MSSGQEVLAWKILRENYIVVEVPIEQPLLEEPEFRLIYDPSHQRLGMRLRLDQGRTWSNMPTLRNITIRCVMLYDSVCIELFTDSKELFRPIYALICDVLSRIADGETDALHALEASLYDFELLIARSAQLSKEKVVGLYGELLVLESLIAEDSFPADVWIGAKREPHDFRLGVMELEIKTTTSNVRKHTIHGLNQLSPTPNHTLHLVSVRLGSAGSANGRSLNDLIDAIRSSMSSNKPAIQKFEQSLMQIGYESDHHECTVKYQIAAPIMAIAIGSDFPIMSYDWLSTSLGSESAVRLRDIQLTLDLEGLGTHFNINNYKE